MRFTDEEKFAKIREVQARVKETGENLKDVLMEAGLNTSTYYKWRNLLKATEDARRFQFGNDREGGSNGTHAKPAPAPAVSIFHAKPTPPLVIAAHSEADPDAEKAYLRTEVARLKKLLADLITRNKTIEDVVQERI